MVDIKQFAQLPATQRRQDIEGDLSIITQLEQHAFRNRKDIKVAVGDLVMKVNGHGLGLANALIEQSLGVEIDDPQATNEFDIAGGKDKWLDAFWGATFKSILQAILGAKESGRFGDVDAARRLHLLNETTLERNHVPHLAVLPTDARLGCRVRVARVVRVAEESRLGDLRPARPGVQDSGNGRLDAMSSSARSRSASRT